MIAQQGRGRGIGAGMAGTIGMIGIGGRGGVVGKE
jgi:hypothetical protein